MGGQPFFVGQILTMRKERTEQLNRVLDLRQPDLTVLLENVYDPHNVSAVMRSCDAVGITEIYVLTTERPEKKYNWGFRSSSSALKWMIVHRFTDLDACVKAIRLKYQKMYTTQLGASSKEVYQIDFTQPVALVFGNEHSGCSPAIIAAADGNFLIPQVGMIHSLNISVACAVSIYEAYRQKKAAGHYDTPRLPIEQRRNILWQWEDYEGALALGYDGDMERSKR